MVRRKFTEEFKFEAVKLVTERGAAMAQTARDIDRAATLDAGGRRGTDQRAELAEISALKKEVAKFEAERDILRKGRRWVHYWWRILREAGDMRSAFIAKHRHIRPVSWMCEVLEVARFGCHAWLTRPLRDRVILDAKLVTAIDTSFKAMIERMAPAGTGTMSSKKGRSVVSTGPGG